MPFHFFQKAILSSTTAPTSLLIPLVEPYHTTTMITKHGRPQHHHNDETMTNHRSFSNTSNYGTISLGLFFAMTVLNWVIGILVASDLYMRQDTLATSFQQQKQTQQQTQLHVPQPRPKSKVTLDLGLGCGT